VFLFLSSSSLSLSLSLLLTHGSSSSCSFTKINRDECGAAALNFTLRIVQVQPIRELDFSASATHLDAVPAGDRETFAQV
jgi:hypothetical protein